MNHLDLLPAELIAQIASAGRDVYWPLATGYPRFARSLTPGRRVDYAISFGHDVRVCMTHNRAAFLMWTLNERFHRTDGPAIQYENGDYAWWLKDSHWGIDGAPFYKVKGISMWRYHCYPHRLDGPAISCEYCGSEMWFKHGICERQDGPAITLYEGHDNRCCHSEIYDELSQLDLYNFPSSPWNYREAYLTDGVLHRIGGPALTYYDIPSRIHEEYYIHGERTTKDGRVIRAEIA